MCMCAKEALCFSANEYISAVRVSFQEKEEKETDTGCASLTQHADAMSTSNGSVTQCQLHKKPVFCIIKTMQFNKSEMPIAY